MLQHFLLKSDDDDSASVSMPTVSSSKSEETRLPDDFEPNNYTVLCGRGKKFTESIGNRRLRIIVSMYLERYDKATCKIGKSVVVSIVIDIIQEAGGLFCRRENDTWWEIGPSAAREKVGALFRDFLHTKYRSSTKSKIIQRRRKRLNPRAKTPVAISHQLEAIATYDSDPSSDFFMEPNQSPSRNQLEAAAAYDSDPSSDFFMEPIMLTRSTSESAATDFFERYVLPISFDTTVAANEWKLESDEIFNSDLANNRIYSPIPF
jgi:hypothetical protein